MSQLTGRGVVTVPASEVLATAPIAFYPVELAVEPRIEQGDVSRACGLEKVIVRGRPADQMPFANPHYPL